MSDNIKTFSLVAIAAVLFGYTIYKITADDDAAPTTETEAVALTEATIAEGESTDPAAPSLPPTTMTFKETVFDFGELVAGTRASHTFEFTNTGQNPLVITNARGSCGCTVPAWPKEPIAPGESGSIEVEYNSTGKSGAVQQTVTIDANTTPPQTQLTIKVIVNVESLDQPAS